jgi:heme oxygenase
MLSETAAGEVSAQPCDTSRSRRCAGLRGHLREATRPAHARLDAAFGALDLTSRVGYRAFLEATAAALIPLEQTLESSGIVEAFSEWPCRVRRHALRADLAALGGTARPLPLPAPFEPDEMLGVLYVLEGSRLGARVLIETVAASTDWIVREAAAYLRHGEDARLWPTFLTALAHRAANGADAARVTAGAELAFALFWRGAELHLAGGRAAA